MQSLIFGCLHTVDNLSILSIIAECILVPFCNEVVIVAWHIFYLVPSDGFTKIYSQHGIVCNNPAALFNHRQLKR